MTEWAVVAPNNSAPEAISRNAKGGLSNSREQLRLIKLVFFILFLVGLVSLGKAKVEQRFTMVGLGDTCVGANTMLQDLHTI